MLTHPYTKYCAYLLILVYVYFETAQHQDFDIFLAASTDYLHGENIFAHSYESGFHFFYSPLFAAMLIPFTFLPIHVSRIIWLLLNIFALTRCFKLLKRYFDFDKFSKRQKLFFDVFSLVFSAKLILDNFHNGQVTIFMLLFMLEGLRLIKSGNPLWGAALIALGINFKFLPLVLLPYLFYNKQLKACVYIVMWYAVFLFLPALIHGWQQNQQLLKDWFASINPSNKQHLIDTDETTLNGLTTLIPTLLMEKVPDMYALPIKRNILNLDVNTVTMIINIVRLLLVVFVLYFIRRKIFTQAKTKLQELWELSYVFLLIPLIFPHQQHYAFFLMLPASMYVIYTCFYTKIKGQKNAVTIIVLMVLVFLLTNAHLLLGEFREYYDHYKIITYGALLMAGLLAYLRPSVVINEK